MNDLYAALLAGLEIAHRTALEHLASAQNYRKGIPQIMTKGAAKKFARALVGIILAIRTQSRILKRKNVSPMMTSSPPNRRRSVMSSPLTNEPFADLLSSM